MIINVIDVNDRVAGVGHELIPLLYYYLKFLPFQHHQWDIKNNDKTIADDYQCIIIRKKPEKSINVLNEYSLFDL